MIPDVRDMPNDFAFRDMPGKTYRIDPKAGIMKGIVDGREAVKQAIYLILGTERTEYELYSWNYGVEIKNQIGLPLELACAKIENTIIDALMQDDRIIAVGNFSFSSEGGRKLHTAFTVGTREGDIETGWEFDV